jgi:hypothetical protein
VSGTPALSGPRVTSSLACTLLSPLAWPLCHLLSALRVSSGVWLTSPCLPGSQAWSLRGALWRLAPQTATCGVAAFEGQEGLFPGEFPEESGASDGGEGTDDGLEVRGVCDWLPGSTPNPRDLTARDGTPPPRPRQGVEEVAQPVLTARPTAQHKAEQQAKRAQKAKRAQGQAGPGRRPTPVVVTVLSRVG